MGTKKPKRPRAAISKTTRVASGKTPRAEARPSYAELVRIVEVLRSTERFSEFRLKAGDIEIEVKRPGGAPLAAPAAAVVPVTGEPAAALPAPAPVTAAEVASLPPGLELVRAPSMGVFYRAPKPGEPPFVEPGARVEPDTTVGLVEVMKLFSSVLAGCSGTVTHVLVADGASVAEGQPLVAVRHGA